MLKRTLEKDIFDWIHHGKEALLIAGARQTGKTYLIRECLKASKRPFIEVTYSHHLC